MPSTAKRFQRASTTRSRKPAQQDAVHDAEHRRAHTYARAQRRQHRHDETRSPPPLTDGVNRIRTEPADQVRQATARTHRPDTVAASSRVQPHRDLSLVQRERHLELDRLEREQVLDPEGCGLRYGRTIVKG